MMIRMCVKILVVSACGGRILIILYTEVDA